MRRAGELPLWAALVALLAPAVLPACRAADGFSIPSSRPGPYDALPEPALARVREARTDWDAGQLRVARARLLALAEEHPRNVPLGVLLQELELETLERGGELPDLDLYASDEGWSEALRRIYRERAERSPTPERLVLAARLETDLPAARVLLERAAAADPQCAWAHYGAAHVAQREGRYAEGRAALERALEIDPGNLAARRLQARTLLRSARTEVALRAHERWLAAARSDPFVRPRELAEARFDLAILYAEVGRASDVEDLCAGLLAEGVLDRAPIYLVLAAARISTGDVEAALDAASRASRLASGDALAHVQRALILEDWMARPERAWDAWARALEVARGTAVGGLEGRGRPRPSTTRDAQLWLQARTRLARLSEAGVQGTAEPAGRRP